MNEKTVDILRDMLPNAKDNAVLRAFISSKLEQVQRDRLEIELCTERNNIEQAMIRIQSLEDDNERLRKTIAEHYKEEDITEDVLMIEEGPIVVLLREENERLQQRVTELLDVIRELENV